MIISLLNRIDDKLVSLISTTSKNVFAFCANFRQLILLRNQTLFHYCKKSNLFYATQGSKKIYFFSKLRQLRLYSRGLLRRLNLLSKDYFLEEINFKKGDYVVDCGANIGELYHCLKYDQNYINYVAFEPSNDEYKCLKKNTKEQKCFNIALSNSSGKKDFYLSSEKADSSLIKPISYTTKITQNTSRLDEILPKVQIKLLKIEAEGSELEVLEGCSEILKNINYIAADLGPERGVNLEVTYDTVVPFLVKKGFLLERVNNRRYTFLFRNPNF